MLELVAQSVADRGSGDARTGGRDLLEQFMLAPYYKLSMSGKDRNYIAVSTKEVPTGLPGDVALYAHPSWSLLRPPPPAPAPSEPAERVAERVRRGLRLGPGPAALAAADKGQDVTGVFMRNVPGPAAPRAAGPAPSSQGGGGGSQGGGGKRRAAPSASAAYGGGGHSGEQVSGDTVSMVSHESKRQRSAY